MPKKRKKKSKLKLLNDSLDNLWSEIVKQRAGFKCEYCGNTTTLNSHHIFSRSNFSVRWDLDNGISLCALHHVLGTFSAHKAPLEFADWIKEQRGQDWYDNLKAAANQVGSYSMDEKEEIKDLLTKELKAGESRATE